MPVVLYGCETRSLILGENRVTEKVFGPKKTEMAEGWSKLYSEERRYFYYSPYMIRNIKSSMVKYLGHVERKGGKRTVCRIFVGQSQVEINQYEDQDECRWIALRWILYRKDWDWICVAQDRDNWRALVSAVREPS
jgi:hypothetical protein